MPRRCTVCEHPQTAAIAKDVAAGGSNRAVARRYGLTDSAIQRHRTNCLKSPRRAKADESLAGTSSQASTGDSRRFGTEAGEISKPSDLLTRLQSLFRLGDLLEEAYQKRDVDAVVKLAREYRSAAETYAKVAGWLTDGVQVNVDARSQTALLAKVSEDDLRALLRTTEAAPIEAESANDNRGLSIANGEPIEAEVLALPP